MTGEAWERSQGDREGVREGGRRGKEEKHVEEEDVRLARN